MKISKEKAEKQLAELRKNSEKKEQELLAIINKKENSEKSIIDIVKTVADAFKICGENYATFKKKCKLAGDAPHEVASKELLRITRALNYDPITKKFWTPDYRNRSEKKWEIVWVWDEASGRFVFNYSFFVCVSASSNVGVRRVFKTEQIAVYAARNFADVFNIDLK